MKLKIEKIRMPKCKFLDEDYDIGKKGNADDVMPKSKKKFMLYCDLGFKTVSVLPGIWSHIKQVGVEAQVDAFGILCGRKKGTDIEINLSFRLNPDVNRKKKKLDLKNVHDSTNMEFLGFYSYGKIPNDNDVNILEEIVKNCKSSVFLLKIDLPQKSRTLSATIFECYKIEKYLGLLQLHNHPECKGPISGSINKDISETAIKIFYIESGKRGLHHCKQCTEEKELKIEENYMRLQRNAKKMNLRSKIIMHQCLWFLGKKLDYVKLLNEFVEQSKFEVTYNFTFRIGGPVEFDYPTVDAIGFSASISGLSMEDNLQAAAKAVLYDVMRRR